MITNVSLVTLLIPLCVYIRLLGQAPPPGCSGCFLPLLSLALQRGGAENICSNTIRGYFMIILQQHNLLTHQTCLYH